jgi:hypothetical protein
VIDSKNLLAGLPEGLRNPLIASYQEIVRNYAERRWEPAELNGGKLCEVTYTIIEGALSARFAAKPSKPANMVEACRALEKRPAEPTRVGDRSMRVLVPRMLTSLYEIRNNRNVGHVGSDVDPNYLDASAVLASASWVVAELVRIFHNVSTEAAQESVNALVERKTPLIWEVGELRRVLDSAMSAKDQTLLLLYQRAGWERVSDLVTWVEYSSASQFQSRILDVLHRDRYIEYDRAAARARISPKGSNDVEERILHSRGL